MDLSSLREAFKPLVEASHREKTVEVMGVTVTLRTITPQEEIDIQKAIPDLNSDEQVTPLEFVDAFRRETLSRSIVQINDLDLRSVSVLETGEVTDSGVKVKVSKEEGVFEIVNDWSRLIVTKLFEAFTELVEETEQALTESLEISPEMLEAQRDALQGRVDELNRAVQMEEVASQSSSVREVVSEIEEGGLFTSLEGMGS